MARGQCMTLLKTGTAVAAFVLFLGQVVSGRAVAETAAASPQRIASLNLCTDQMLMMLVEPERIVSISFLSLQNERTPPELRGVASGLEVNHGLAEEILLQEPDLVLAGTYAARPAVGLLRRMGVRVEDFEPEMSFEDMRSNLLRMGELVGETQKAEAIIAAFDTELAALKAEAGEHQEMPVFADIDVNNWLAGSGTLSAEIVNAGGYRTLAETLGVVGHQNVPLEQLVTTDPDLMAMETPWSDPPSLATNGLQHPALQRMAATREVIDMPERFTICATPYSLEGARLLARQRAGGE